MDIDYDVVIIGAGPVGGYTARLLCERGLSVVMVEEHNEVGRPFQCAGLVTPSAMDAVEAYDTVVEDVDGALIHGPSGTLVPVGRQGELRTYVVCRKRFDQTVVQQGLEAGADLLLESQPTSAEVKPDGVEIEIINQRTKETRTLRYQRSQQRNQAAVFPNIATAVEIIITGLGNFSPANHKSKINFYES